MQIEKIAPEKLKPYERNARTHSPAQVEKIARSIDEFGFINPVLVDRSLNIIAGHGRVLAAKQLGLKEVPCLYVDGLSDTQIRAYIIADNKLALDAGWDDEILRVEMKALLEVDFDITLTGFELGDIEFDDDDADNDDISEADYYDDELDDEPKAKRGDIYKLGRHLVMCGDSTSEHDVKRLLGDIRPQLVLTDPPYGVDIVRADSVGGDSPNTLGRNSPKSIGIAKAGKYKKIKGDETTDTARLNYELIRSLSDNQIFFGGNYFTDFLPPSSCWVVWDKQNGDSVFGDCELAWSSFDKKIRLYQWRWNGMQRQGDRESELKRRVHPTQKPVGLLCDILSDFAKDGDTIFDGFGGSGSTLIACEKQGLCCVMIECEPEYVDIIIKRWEDFTGQTAELLSEEAHDEKE